MVNIQTKHVETKISSEKNSNPECQKVIESSDILRISNALDVTPNDLFGINKKK